MSKTETATPMVHRRTALALIASAFPLAKLMAADDAAVVALNGWVRVPSPARDMTAFYVELENHTNEKRALVSASSDAAEKVELHEMKMEGNMMRMSPVAQIEIPANGKVSLKPGSFHVMLFGLKNRPAEGDKVRMTLKLDNGVTIPVTATVRQQSVE